jgi:adenylate cyclase
MKKKSGSRWALLLPLLPVLAGLAFLLVDSRGQQALRNNQFDQFQRWHPRTYEPAPVRVVDIDEESLARLGQWPWPRTRIAELVDKLGAAGAAAVGFDVMFSEPDRTSPKVAVDLWQLKGQQRADVQALPDHDEVFTRSLEKGDAVLGFAVLREENTVKTAAQAATTPLKRALPEQKGRFVYAGEEQSRWLHHFDYAVTSMPAFEKAAKGNGALTFVPDGDGVVRRVPLVFQIDGTPVGTLVSESLRVAQGAKNVLLKGAGQGSGLAEIRIGDVTIPTTPQGEMWVHYTRAVKERYVPAWKVLAGEVPPDQLSGNVVLVGSSAQGLMDLRFSPFGLMPGVEAHAQGLEQILTGHFLQRPSWARGTESLLLMLSGMLAGVLALRTRALVSASATVLLVAGIVGGAWWAFVSLGLLLDAATPALGVLLTYVLCSLWHHFSSEREQRWIKDAFSRYVSPNRVAHLVDNPDDMALGGKRQTCSFIFTDLAGFTTLMERIDPAQAVSLLNAYLDEMIAIAFRHEGTLDRIVGDAVAIMFSAPVPQTDHRVRALACALEMDRFANTYSNALLKGGTAFGKTRIGVHSGEVIVGNFGGSNMFDYRALGDPVNTAARLESVNKHLGTRMCVSEAILVDNPEAVVRPVGRLVLKGKSQALAVFEPVTEDTMPRAPLEDYRLAFEALHSQAPEAATLFAQLAQDWPQDPLVLLHHGRLASGEQGDLIVMSAK